MNKKSGTICAIFFFLFLLAGCSNKDEKEHNYFGGKGEIQYNERLNGRNALYDDENIYFNFFMNMKSVLVKFDYENNLTVDCENAACKHDTTDCKAYIGDDAEYFLFHEKIYLGKNEIVIKDGNKIKKGKIIDCKTGKVVFENQVPKELDEEKAIDDETEIFFLRILDKDILKVQGYQYAYLLNENFEIIYWHEDVGRFPWGCIYDNKYYYINDLYELVCVYLDTQEKEIIDLKDKVFAGDNEGDFIYYSNEFKELYQYSLIDGTTTKLLDNCLFFSVYDGYIYCLKSAMGEEKQKLIIDVEGNLIFDYTSYANMGVDDIIKIKDKIYTWFDCGIAQMDADGKNYKEYLLE